MKNINNNERNILRLPFKLGDSITANGKKIFKDIAVIRVSEHGITLSESNTADGNNAILFLSVERMQELFSNSPKEFTEVQLQVGIGDKVNIILDLDDESGLSYINLPVTSVRIDEQGVKYGIDINCTDMFSCCLECPFLNKNNILTSVKETVCTEGGIHLEFTADDIGTKVIIVKQK